MKKEAVLWHHLAQEDWEMSQLLFENHRYSGAVFFAQQAVEKMLKCIIIDKKKILPTKTHKIETLVKQAGLSLDDIGSPDVSELSDAYIRVRYPDLNAIHYRRRENVTPLLSLARKVYLWAKKISSKP